MPKRSSIIVVALVVGGLAWWAIPRRAAVSSAGPTLNLLVKAHVKANLADSYIGDLPIAEICVLKKKQKDQGKDPAVECKNYPYKINWFVTIDDPTGKCGGKCRVSLTRKDQENKNKDLFDPRILKPGDNEWKPDKGYAKYGLTTANRKFVYALQLTIDGVETGRLYDPDVMPHKPGG